VVYRTEPGPWWSAEIETLTALAGHAGRHYESPPQSEEQARALIRLLAGIPHTFEGDGPWERAVAGGKVIQAGKPFAPIFERALELARGPGTKIIDRARVLVIGDAMRTDIKGAHDQGFNSLFVTSGIHRKELHGATQDTGLDAAAFRQFMEAADFAPTAAIPALVW